MLYVLISIRPANFTARFLHLARKASRYCSGTSRIESAVDKEGTGELDVDDMDVISPGDLITGSEQEGYLARVQGPGY